jgi:hypothetical protein
MTDFAIADEVARQDREQLWELGGLADGQTVDFGVLVISYIDRDGESRFNWRVVLGSGPVEGDAVIELLADLAASVEANQVEFDGPNGLMDSGDPGESTDP